jgi:RimJ/RimL family protein N-acetyltransferase
LSGISDSSPAAPDDCPRAGIREPLQGLRLRTPRVELRLGSRAELRALGELFRDGTYPEEMAGVVTDLRFEGVKARGWAEDFVSHHESWLRESTPIEWFFNILAFSDAGVIGSQGLQSRPNAAVFTNSLIGRRHQRQGYGTEMRAAVLQLAFTVLGATRAISDAWIGNRGSLGVSGKLGYVDAGTELRHPRGDPVVHQVLHLDATHFTSPVPIVLEGAEELAAWVASPREWRGSS